MSDDEDYEYEYDDDDDDNNNGNGGDDDDDDAMEEEDQPFEYTDEEEEADDTQVALENAYYNAKGFRESNLTHAANAFEQVIQKEQQEMGSAGMWSFKAMKQLVKLFLRANDVEAVRRHYTQLLNCISTSKEVSPNAVEKGIQGMLERVASQPHHLAVDIYDETLQVFHPRDGACKNERLWFKANLKYGQLLYEMNDTTKLQKVLKDLQALTSSNTQSSLEIYTLRIQLYSRLKDHKRLRETFNKAMAVRGGSHTREHWP